MSDVVAFFQPQGTGSVICDPKASKAIVEFHNRRFDTSNPEIIKMLDELGYPRIDKNGPVTLVSTTVKVGDHIYKFPNRPEALEGAKKFAQSYEKTIKKAEADEVAEPLPNSPQVSEPAIRTPKRKAKKRTEE
jgi:hypothetical protein